MWSHKEWRMQYPAYWSLDYIGSYSSKPVGVFYCLPGFVFCDTEKFSSLLVTKSNLGFFSTMRVCIREGRDTRNSKFHLSWVFLPRNELFPCVRVYTYTCAYATSLLCVPTPTCIRAYLHGWASFPVQLTDEEHMSAYVRTCLCTYLHTHTPTQELCSDGHIGTYLPYLPARLAPNRHDFKSQRFSLSFFAKTTKNTCISILGRSWK